MRPIKFRVWNKIQKVMGEIGGIDLKRQLVLSITYKPWHVDVTDGWKRNSGFVLMQYTGLNDKNGKEIYEGDLCRDDDGNIDMPVELIEGVFCFAPKSYRALREYENLEIIGNIYENPELLKLK